MSTNSQLMVGIVRSIQKAMDRHDCGDFSDLDLINQVTKAVKRADQLTDLSDEDVESWNDGSTKP